MGRPAAPRDWKGWFVLAPEPVGTRDCWWIYDWSRVNEDLPRTRVYYLEPERIYESEGYRLVPAPRPSCEYIQLGGSGATVQMCVYLVQ